MRMGVDKARRDQPVAAIDREIGTLAAGISACADLGDAVIANQHVSAVDHPAFGVEHQNQRIVQQRETHDRFSAGRSSASNAAGATDREASANRQTPLMGSNSMPMPSSAARVTINSAKARSCAMIPIDL